MKKKSIVRTHIEVKIIFIAVAVLFVWFLAVPIVTLLLKSFQSDTGALWVHYADVFSGRGYAIYPGKVTDADTFRIGSTTGYTDVMMDLVAPKAAELGYAPDCWFSPDSVGGLGRPYPYMIFKNMERLKISSVEAVMKVGDTISDIREGKNAGVFTVGILEGSFALGLSEEEYLGLSRNQKESLLKTVEEKYRKAGADAVVKDIRGILKYLA